MALGGEFVPDRTVLPIQFLEQPAMKETCAKAVRAEVVGNVGEAIRKEDEK